MTSIVDVVNNALQIAGTRTNVTQSEFQNQTSNEAKQAALSIYTLRDQLLRMAPWDCAFNYINLALITSTPGTPENPSQITQTWVKGQPPPPWGYEYAYPADCLRACWVIPWLNTGFASSVPITTAVTGSGAGPPTSMSAPAVPFKIAIDQFWAVSAATVANAGTGYKANDLIYLNPGLYGPNNIPTFNPPIGAPAIIFVNSVDGGGAITAITLLNTFQQSQPEQDEVLSGAYFQQQTSPMAQSTTNGSGTGATFNVTWAGTNDQRVILTNQEFATLAYVKQVLDPNIMDPLFLGAWEHILAARLVYQFSGDKALANQKLGEANNLVMEARKADGNEGLTINDVTPDFLRIRGSYGPASQFTSSIGGFNWGPLFIPY